MILSADYAQLLALLAAAAYLLAAVPVPSERRWPVQALVAAWVLQGAMLVAGAGLWGSHEAGLRIGFAPVLSFTIWLVLAVHGIESRFVPIAGLRRALAVSGALAVTLAFLFPGELRAVAHSRWAPLHWVLGISSYGLVAVAVLHALMLDAAERQMRQKKQKGPSTALGMPLLKLEKLTFRFVEAGFVVLTLALALGLGSSYWHWDHKTILSMMGWVTLAALLVGRLWRGWRGRQATRWLYAGAVLLLLAYVGSRFVLEVLLQRGGAGAV